MTRIEIYSKPWCGYCYRAKSLLKSKGLKYEETRVTGANLAEMQARAGRNTVPQIFIDGVHIGGSDELVALENSGKLDQLLSVIPRT